MTRSITPTEFPSYGSSRFSTAKQTALPIVKRQYREKRNFAVARNFRLLGRAINLHAKNPAERNTQRRVKTDQLLVTL